MNLIARLHTYEPKNLEQVTQKKSGEGRATKGIDNIQIYSVNVGINYGELLNQKVVILAKREPFTKNMLQGALGMRSIFALFNQNFQITAKVVSWT